MNDPKQIQAIALGLLGAIIGGTVGYFVFIWIAHQGFYALMLPGLLLGEGAGLLARRRSVALGITAAVLAIFLGLFSEWKIAPFAADPSFAYFLAHVQDLKPLTLIFVALGAFLAYRGAAGRIQRYGP
jgi:hypothetical protein